MRGSIRISLALAALACVQAAAEPVPRAQPAAGSVIARKSGEEVRFIDVSSWQAVDLRQDVVPGDYLRTNAYGTLAVLFADRTQMRLGRNTTLLVKEIGGGSDTRFSLEQGSIWARAERGGVGLTVDTPAAAAAIRGTDWTMTVDGNGRTSLTVLEGTVELANEFGSVSVAEGEAAAASIGSAPTKLVIVAPKDREQMLFFLSARSSFNLLPASSLSSADMRKARSRITAIAPTNRSAEDWLTLAEVSLSYEGRDAALETATRARGFSLSRAQKARLDLVDALIAGADQRYVEAAQLFAAAAPHLDRPRRAMAEFGGYYARSLADPTRAENPPVPAGGGPYAAIAEAFTAGFLVDIKAAIAVLEKAERRYPGDPTLPAVRAQFAMLLDDREQMEEGIDKALALDPDDPTALEARSFYRAGYKGDIEGAYADIARAAEIAPGSTTIWNQLGLVQSARGAEREAEAALKRAIELDPQDPASRANLAIHYLDQGRVAEAKAEIDKALELDRSFDIALIARGRYHLQIGKLDKAREDLLAGTTANPGYSQGLLLLAAGYYESGERDAAKQAIENADRLDPNDPVTSAFRTALAIDEYRSDDAITYAQQALARAQARGGDYRTLSANQDQGSTLNAAYRLQGLDAWGRYYGDAVFDPFNAGGYIDQAVSGSSNPFSNDINFGGQTVEPDFNSSGFSSFLQGLMLEPSMISGRSRSANLARRPFLEGSIGGGFISQDEDGGRNYEAEIQGYLATPIQTSFLARVETLESEDFRSSASPGASFDNTQFTLGDDLVKGTGFVALEPTPNDRVVAYVDFNDETDRLVDVVQVLVPPIPIIPPVSFIGHTYDRTLETRNTTAGLAWSHTFGHQNVGSAALFASSVEQNNSETGILVTNLPGFAGMTVINDESSQTNYIGAINHTYGMGDFIVRYGLEGGRFTDDRLNVQRDFLFFPDVPDAPEDSVETITTASDIAVPVVKAYIDALYGVTPELTLEAGIFGTYLGGVLDVQRAEPRLGASWTPVGGHLLRAAFMRETSLISNTTLGPVGVLGLQSNQISLDPGGRADTFAARWDAEWTDRFFTSLDYQHQDATDLSILIPGGISTVDITEGRIDRVAGTANYWIGGGFGASATMAYANSENLDPNSIGFGGDLPFIPELSGQLALSYVNPANLKITVAATYIGDRTDSFGDPTLDGYWTADAFLTWEPLDKRFALELSAYNLFDTEFLVDRDMAGWGQTFTGSFKVRF
jgi:tetratricopeptide (TPR) repeat protein